MADRVEFKLEGFERTLALLQALPAEVVGNRGGVVKKWLRKGAQSMAKKVVENLRGVTSNQTTHPDRENTKLLEESAGVVKRGRPPASGKGERYIVTTKRRVYPGRNGKAATTTVQNQQRLEYGTSEQPAEPHVRPAVLSEGERVIRLIETGVVNDVDRLAAKYLKG